MQIAIAQFSNAITVLHEGEKFCAFLLRCGVPLVGIFATVALPIIAMLTEQARELVAISQKVAIKSAEPPKG